MKRLRLNAVALDVLFLLLLIAAAVIADTGGVAWRSAGRRYSIQDPWRPLLWAGAVLGIRFWMHGPVGPFGRPWRKLVESFGLIEDVSRAAQAPALVWRELGLVLAGLVAVVVVVCHVQIADFYLVPDMGDPLFSMWRISWVTHQIIADPRHLFDANIFYPAPLTLTFSDSMILPALTGAPLLWAGVHPAVVYTLLFLSGFVLSGLCAYMLARGLGLGAGAAWIAALAFGFYPYRFDHYSHLELQMAQWAPIALLGVHRVLTTGRLRYAVLLMLAVGAQWYSSMYYGLFLMFYAAAFAAVLIVAWRPGWRRIAYAGGGLLLGVALAVPLARVYAASEPARGTRPVDAITDLSADAADYLRPTKRSALYKNFGPGKRLPERDLFPGLVPLALGAVGVVPPLTPASVAILAAGIVAFDGSMGLKGHWYPIAHRWLSPMRSMRVPARFAIFVGLTLAILSAFGVDRICRRIASTGKRRALVSLLTVAVMADVWPILDLRPVWKAPPSLYASLGPQSGAVLFEYPFHPHPDWFAENLPYMYFSIWHWTKMLNGYSGFSPASYWTAAQSTAGFPRGGTVAYLKSAGVTHVAVHCAFSNPPACAQILREIDADVRFRLVVTTRWQGADSRLYELRQ